MSKMILIYFLQYLVISKINCNAIGYNTIRVENSDFTIACSRLTAQRISAFTVIVNSSLNCFDEYVYVAFDLVDIRQANKTIPEQAFLGEKGC